MGKVAGADADLEMVEVFKKVRGERAREAFCALYERHAGGVRAYLLRMTRSPDLADDLTQEAFLHALNGLAGFSGDCSFKTWVYQIAMNRFRDHLRRKRPAAGAEWLTSDNPDSALAPDELAQRNEEVQRVRDAVAALPEELRAPLVLVRFEGLKYREAAEVLGITLDAVRMRVHRAHMGVVPLLT